MLHMTKWLDLLTKADSFKRFSLLDYEGLLRNAAIFYKST